MADLKDDGYVHLSSSHIADSKAPLNTLPEPPDVTPISYGECLNHIDIKHLNSCALLRTVHLFNSPYSATYQFWQGIAR